jgi:uncharacterized repeat protein (TIGR01451 family)
MSRRIAIVTALATLGLVLVALTFIPPHTAQSGPAASVWVRVNYAHDWVEGNYEAGHTVWITATNSGGTVKATAVLTTGAWPDWGGQTGFSTNWQGWIPSQPDIVPGDWVYVRVDDGSTTTVRVGTITGNLSVASDSITGTITANWFTQTLNARCEVWAQNGPPGIDMIVNPNSGGSYSCDFGALGWDVLPGQNVAVLYFEPDYDQVINVFRGPAPDLRVEKWPEGGGQVLPGGPVVFGIRYWNQGDGAGEAILTDTLPLSTTYVTDTSGFPAFVSGNVITWNLGSVQPYTLPVQFQLVLTNSASLGDMLNNRVDIGAQYEMNWGDNHAEAQVQVGSGQPDLQVNKDASPGDPAPGQLFRYDINYNNNGSVASGSVWLTDTLPLSTTFVSWQSENGYSLWTTVVTTGGKLALYAPTLPGNYGDRIFLTLRLSDTVPYDTQLINTVEITTTGDSNPDDNRQVNDWTWTRRPRYDVSEDKYWGHGALMPGGEINYYINYNNGGNSPAHNVVVTDTLPAGTTFITSVIDLGWGVTTPFLPSSFVGNQLVWNLGTLEVNANKNWRITLQITPTTPVGTVLTNCATIAMSDFEDNPYDNDKCVTETVRAAGTNLRVKKFGWWQGQGGLHYFINIENIGTKTVNNVTITDTFPVSMTLNKLNVKFGEQWSSGVSGNQLTVTLSRLEPGLATGMDLWLSVPPVPNGTLFTNTAEMTTPTDDVNPADNSSVLVVGTGPDLSIEKWLTGGTPKPGQLITYTLHFQNHSQAWWTAGNVWITDTLPAGLQFITSTQRLCGEAYFCPSTPNYDGTSLTWNWGQMGNGWWNDFVVTVRVTDTAKGGAVFTNTATIASDDPANDVEPFYNDNTSVVTATIVQYKIYLPVIVRN